MGVKIRKGGEWVTCTGDFSGKTRVAKIYDAKTQGDGGGTYSSGWVDRVLNSKTDPQSFVTFGGGSTGTDGTNTSFSLAAGTYKIKWDTPSYMLGNYQSRLQYSSDSGFTSSTSVVGSTEFAMNNPGVLNTLVSSDGIAVLTLAQTTYFKIQVKGSATPGDSNALRKAANLDTEIYTQVAIEDLATSVKDSVLEGTGRCAVLEDQKASNTPGGTFTAGAWQDRTLNTETDPKGFVTLDSGNVYFSLAAGTYEIDWSAPATMVDKHQTRLMFATNTGFTNGVGYVYGSSEMVDQNESPNVDCTRSFGSAIKTLTETTYFKIQHRCSTTSTNTNGFGTPNNFTGDSQVEVYTKVKIQDLATAVKNNADYVAGTSRVALLKDQKNFDINGGSFTNNAWRDRDLTVEEDPSSFVNFTAGGSQSSGSAGNTPGYWSLGAGTYRIEWSAPGYEVNRHKTRLVYSTTEAQISASGLHASALFVEGSTANASNIDLTDELVQTDSAGSKIITITETTYFKIMHWCTNSRSDWGFGDGMYPGGSYDTGPNIYTQVRIEDLATAVANNASNTTGTAKVATLQHQEAQNTDAGDFISGAWHKRELTTENDPQNFVNFPVPSDSDPYSDWSLPAGSYKIRWSAPGYRVNTHQTRLIYATNSSFTSPTYVMGSSEESPAVADESQTRSFGETILTLTAAETWFRVEHRCQTSEAGNGQGHASNFATEVYTEVSIEDLATAVKNAGDDYVAGNTRIATIQDVKPYDTGGGNVDTAAQWLVRDLNTVTDAGLIGITSTTDGIISIPAGTYKFNWRAPAYDVGRHVSRLVYSTSATLGAGTSTALIASGGVSETSAGGPHPYSWSMGVAPSLTFGDTTYFRIEQTFQTIKSDSDADGRGVSNANLGLSASDGESIYTTVEVEDLKTAVKSQPAAESFVKQVTFTNGPESTFSITSSDGWVGLLTQAITIGNSTNRVKIDTGGKPEVGGYINNTFKIGLFRDTTPAEANAGDESRLLYTATDQIADNSDNYSEITGVVWVDTPGSVGIHTYYYMFKQTQDHGSHDARANANTLTMCCTEIKGA